MKIIKDYVGQTFGELTVLSLNVEKTNESIQKQLDGRIKKSVKYWECLCSCGNIIDVSACKIGKRTSCGCDNKKKKNERLNLLVGQKYSNLTIIDVDYERNEKEEIRFKNGEIKRQSSDFYICECDCGNIRSVSINDLKSGNTKSCGCYLSQALKISFQKNKKYNKYEEKENYIIGWDLKNENSFFNRFIFHSSFL